MCVISVDTDGRWSRVASCGALSPLAEMRPEFLEPIQHDDKRFVGRLAAVQRLRLHHHKPPLRSDVNLAAAAGGAW
jgi:hypothetical protein